MQRLSNTTCVSVNVGFVPPQSLTHVDYLFLEQKAHTSQILWASNQVLQCGRIFLFVDRNCNQNSCCNYTRKQRLILFNLTNVLTFSNRGRTRHNVGDEGLLQFLPTAKNRRRAWVQTWVRGGSAVEERLSVSVSQTTRERENPALINSPCATSAQEQVEVCPKAKSFLFFVQAFADVFTVHSLRALSGFYIYLYNIY